MQKHYVRFSWIYALCITLLSAYSANAALHYLPRYQTNLSGRENTGGRDKTNLSCSQKGMVDKPTDPCQICQGAVGDCCASISVIHLQSVINIVPRMPVSTSVVECVRMVTGRTIKPANFA